MTRLVLIHDEMRGNFALVTGESRAQIKLKQTVERKNAGYSKVLDVNLPVRQTAQLDFGEVKGALTLHVDCANSSLERTIDQRQRQSLELFLTHGANSLKNQVEKLVSKVKVRVAVPGATPFDQNRAVNLIYPEIVGRMRRLLEQAIQEPNLPFLTIFVSDSLNQSAYVDKLLNQDTQARTQILTDLAARGLTSAYSPEEELRAVREHAEIMMKQWPTSLAPIITDAAQLLPILDAEEDALHQELFLRTPQPGFLSRLLGR